MRAARPHRRGVAVSAQKDGVLPISQQATIVLASLAYHDYEGIAVLDDEKPRLQRDLGANSFLVLRNHGLLTVGASIPDAFLFMFLLQRTCEIQILAQAGGALVEVDPRIVAGVKANLAAVTNGMGGASPGRRCCESSSAPIPATTRDPPAVAVDYRLSTVDPRP